MNRMLLALAATIATTVGTAALPSAQPAIAGDQSAFRFQFEETRSHRALAVEGYVYNALPWRITNVRVQVESFDTNGAPFASTKGGVLADVAGGGALSDAPAG